MTIYYFCLLSFHWYKNACNPARYDVLMGHYSSLCNQLGNSTYYWKIKYISYIIMSDMSTFKWIADTAGCIYVYFIKSNRCKLTFVILYSWEHLISCNVLIMSEFLSTERRNYYSLFIRWNCYLPFFSVNMYFLGATYWPF